MKESISLEKKKENTLSKTLSEIRGEFEDDKSVKFSIDLIGEKLVIC